MCRANAITTGISMLAAAVLDDNSLKTMPKATASAVETREAAQAGHVQ